MTTKKLCDFAYFAHGKQGQFGGWSSNEVEHWLMCALCICAPRNQNNSALWSNITWSQIIPQWRSLKLYFQQVEAYF